MKVISKKVTSKKAILASILVLSISGGASAVFHSSEESRTESQRETSDLTDIYAKAFGIGEDEARRKVGQQAAAEKLNRKVEGLTKDNWSAGTWIDGKTGALTVAVTNDDRARQMRAAGATARVVERSMDELNAIKEKVGNLVEKHSVVGVSWYADVRNNRVALEGEKTSIDGAFLADIKKMADAVAVSYTKAPAAPKYKIPVGSEISTLNGRCSFGWWVRDKSGADLLMTAGHCLDGALPTWFNKGLHIGGGVNHNYGPSDWGTIHVDDIAAPRPSTQVPTPQGEFKISGFSRSPRGTTVCKSGSTTEVTCGQILDHDVNVTFNDGTELKSFTSSTIKSESGDSGGGIYSFDALEPGFVLAEGILSGGNETTTYYQPIDSAIRDSDTIFIKSIDPRLDNGVGLFMDFDGSNDKDIQLQGEHSSFAAVNGDINDQVSRVTNFDSRPYCLYVDNDFSGPSVLDLQPGVTIKLEGFYAHLNDRLSSMKPC